MNPQSTFHCAKCGAIGTTCASEVYGTLAEEVVEEPGAEVKLVLV